MSSDIIIPLLFNLVGGLGIFLLGMKNMQQGLQVVAGPRIRQLINTVTSNRFVSVGIGTVLTMLVQSSSVTTVMVIGLVNSELMSLSGAIGMIMGANIGTTITGWILALKIGKYGLPILGVSAFIWLFVKQEKIRYTFLAILGIGMIFFGLELMKNGFKPLRGHEDFKTWFTLFEAVNYWGVLKAAAVGCLLTVIVQSSSATLGITIALANAGIIDFYTAGALVLGENIGTTITALLASLGADDMNAKRAAYFHSLFNVSGVFVITLLFLPVYMPLVTKGFSAFVGGAPDMVDADGNLPLITGGIATVHSVFNILNTFIFIWLVNPIAKVLMRIGQDKGAEKKYLTNLDFSVDQSTSLGAIERSRHEIERMDSYTREMIDKLRLIIASEQPSKINQKHIDDIFEREDIFDTVEIEITTFLTGLLARPIGSEIAEEARSQLRLTDEYESVSDYIANVLKSFLRLKENEETLSEDQKKEILELHDLVSEYLNKIHDRGGLDSPEEYLENIRTASHEVTGQIRDFRERHWLRLSEHSFSPLVSTTYMDIINAYRRIKDHLLNVGEAFVGGKQIDDENSD